MEKIKNMPTMFIETPTYNVNTINLQSIYDSRNSVNRWHVKKTINVMQKKLEGIYKLQTETRKIKLFIETPLATFEGYIQKIMLDDIEFMINDKIVMIKIADISDIIIL